MKLLPSGAASLWPFCAPSNPVEEAAGVLDRIDVLMVSDSNGMLSFFVKRIDAEMAF